MSEITQQGIDRAIKRVDGLDQKIQEIEDPGDKEVFMVCAFNNKNNALINYERILFIKYYNFRPNLSQ